MDRQLERDRLGLEGLKESFLEAYASWWDSLVDEDSSGRPVADLSGDRLFREFSQRVLR